MCLRRSHATNAFAKNTLSGSHEKEYTALLLLGLSFAMAFAFAIVFVVILVWSLPPTDGAYHSLLVFVDPFVLGIMSLVASVSAAVIYAICIFGITRQAS